MRNATSRGTATLFVLALTMGLGLSVGAQAQERVGNSPVEQILGGSFFPFARSFRRPPERCIRYADRLRSRRDDSTLQPPDFRRLRKVGCAGAGAF